MATLTVRQLEDDIVRRLRIQAAEHGRSAEAEHREILRQALTGSRLPSPARRLRSAWPSSGAGPQDAGPPPPPNSSRIADEQGRRLHRRGGA